LQKCPFPNLFKKGDAIHYTPPFIEVYLLCLLQVKEKLEKKIGDIIKAVIVNGLVASRIIVNVTR